LPASEAALRRPGFLGIAYSIDVQAFIFLLPSKCNMPAHYFHTQQDAPFTNSQSTSVRDGCSGWYAVQVITRQEHRVASMLEHKGYEHFLPLARRKLQLPTRREPEALFPGYVFCRLRPDVNGLIVTTPGVLRILGYGSSPVAVPEEEIRNVRLVADSGLPTETSDILRVGMAVEITEGPLRGLCGLLVAVKNCRKIVVSVELLCRSVTVELNGWDVRVLPQTKAPSSVRIPERASWSALS
jgi:transcription antitermination factor NusG